MLEYPCIPSQSHVCYFLFLKVWRNAIHIWRFQIIHFQMHRMHQIVLCILYNLTYFPQTSRRIFVLHLPWPNAVKRDYKASSTLTFLSFVITVIYSISLNLLSLVWKFMSISMFISIFERCTIFVSLSCYNECIVSYPNIIKLVTNHLSKG